MASSIAAGAVSDAETVGDGTVVVAFTLHADRRTRTRAGHAFHALVEIELEQITRIRVFIDREGALAAVGEE